MKPVLFFALLAASLSASAQTAELGSPSTAAAVAKEYMASQFIVVGEPEVTDGQTLITVKMFDQQCKLYMAPATKAPNNEPTWHVFGQICGPVSAAEVGEWTTDEQGKPRYVRPKVGG